MKKEIRENIKRELKTNSKIRSYIRKNNLHHRVYINDVPYTTSDESRFDISGVKVKIIFTPHSVIKNMVNVIRKTILSCDNRIIDCKVI